MSRNRIIEEFAKQFKITKEITEYVDYCLDNENNDIDLYEIHHILPQSLYPEFGGYKDNSFNRVKLKISDHFIAHYKLALTTDNPKMWFALNSMKNKNKVKYNDINFEAELYEKDKIKIRKLLSDINKEYKTVKLIDSDKLVRIKKEEFNNDIHEEAFKGCCTAILKSTNERVRITNNEYDPDIHLMHTAGMSNYYNISINKFEYIDKTDNHIHINKKVFVKRLNEIVKIPIKDIKDTDSLLLDYVETKPVVKTKSREYLFYNLITKETYKDEANRNIFTDINISVKRKIKVFNLDTNERISIEKEDVGNFLLLSKEIEVYIDISDKENPKCIQLLKKEERGSNIVSCTKSNIKKYLDKNFVNYNRVQEVRKGYVTCTDTRDNTNKQVPCEEFHNNDFYVGIVKNQITVLDIETNRKVRITTEEHKLNKSKYKVEGPSGEKNGMTKTFYLYKNGKLVFSCLTLLKVKEYCKEFSLPYKKIYNNYRSKEDNYEWSLYDKKQ